MSAGECSIYIYSTREIEIETNNLVKSLKQTCDAESSCHRHGQPRRGLPNTNRIQTFDNYCQLSRDRHPILVLCCSLCVTDNVLA